jgi:hypothetical protein
MKLLPGFRFLLCSSHRKGGAAEGLDFRLIQNESGELCTGRTGSSYDGTDYSPFTDANSCATHFTVKAGTKE